MMNTSAQEHRGHPGKPPLGPDSIQFTGEDAFMLSEMLSQLEEIPKKPQALVVALQALPRSSGPINVKFNLLVKLHRLSALEMDLLCHGEARFLRTPGRKTFRLVQVAEEELWTRLVGEHFHAT